MATNNTRSCVCPHCKSGNTHLVHDDLNECRGCGREFATGKAAGDSDESLHNTLAYHGWDKAATIHGAGSYVHSTYPEDSIRTTPDGKWHHTGLRVGGVQSIGKGVGANAIDKHLHAFHNGPGYRDSAAKQRGGKQ